MLFSTVFDQCLCSVTFMINNIVDFFKFFFGGKNRWGQSYIIWRRVQQFSYSIKDS